MKPQKAMGLRVGEFVGVTVETDTSHFRARIKKDPIPKMKELSSISGKKDIQENFRRVHIEEKRILEGSGSMIRDYRRYIQNRFKEQ